METTINDKPAIPVEDFKLIIEAGPTALSINQDKINKAIRAGDRLIEQIAVDGMSDELDAQCNSYLIKLKNTLTDMNNRRKPLTELFDKVRKTFTELEAKIDPAKKDSIYAKVQTERNKYATKKIEEQKRREEEAARKLARDKEVITIKANAENLLREGFIKHLEFAKKSLVDCFESFTLDNWGQHLEEFQYYPLHYRIDLFDGIALVPYSSRLATMFKMEEIAAINVTAKAGKFEPFAKEFQAAMVELHNGLSAKIASKKNELDAISKAKGEEMERLKKEAEERQRKEAERIEGEAAAAREKAAAQVEAEKNVALTNSLFDSQVEVQDGKSETKAVESYEIEVKNTAAWLLIVNLYFSKEAMNEDAAKLEKKTLGQMKKFAESHFKKTGEKIESPYIVYSPVYSVRATK